MGILGIVVGLALLWSGRKRVRISGFASALVSVLDLAVLAVSIVLLGWLGIWVFVGANLMAFVAWSVYLAAKQEEILLYAATQCGASKEEMHTLAKRLQQRAGPFALMGPLERARLVSELAQRARTIEEIEDMALPVALLWTVHRPDLGWLVENFDRLLRLYGLEASEAMRAADTLSAGTKESAATFEDMVEAMVTAAGEQPAA